MRYSFLITTLFLIGCGFNGTQRFQTNDATQTIKQDGSSFTYVIVKLDFIQQIKDLCAANYLKSNFSSDELYQQAVAQCTLKKMDLLNINLGQISNFQSKYCQPTSDLSGFTPAQQTSIQNACQTLPQGL